MFSSKLKCLVLGVVLLGTMIDVAKAKAIDFEENIINSLDSEELPEVALDEDLADVAEGEDEVKVLIDNDAVGKEDIDEDFEVHEAAESGDKGDDEDDEAEIDEEHEGEGIGNEEEEEEVFPDEKELINPTEDVADSEDDEEIIILDEEELLPGDEDEDIEAAEAAWYEKVRQYFAKLGKK